MDRLRRLLKMAIALQSRKIITAQALSEKFGVTLRTVYRDIRALEEAGIPLYGEAGVGYKIVDGFNLPPMMFTEEEINALITGEKLVQKNPDLSLFENYKSAIEKIKAINRKKETAEILEHAVAPSIQPGGFTSRYLSEIQLAITRKRVLFIHYSSIGKGEETERLVEPLAVYFTTSSWILVAWCRLRKALREFRTDRMIIMRIQNEQFDARSFDFEDYFKKQSQSRW